MGQQLTSVDTLVHRTTHAELIGRAPTPEFLDRLARTRQFNAELASRRLLDRETYRAGRSYIRVPVDVTEKYRGQRWVHLHSMLASAATYGRIDRGEIARYRAGKAIDPAALHASGCLL